MKCTHAAVCSGMLILLFAISDAHVYATLSEGAEQNLAPGLCRCSRSATNCQSRSWR